MQQTRASLADFPVAERIKISLGEVLGILLPKTAEEVRSEPFKDRPSIVQKLIRSSEAFRAVRQENSDALRNRFGSFWKGEHGKAFYDTYAYRFEESFLKDHYPVIENLKELVDCRDFSAIYEVGCGDGKVLNHVANLLPSIPRVVGIDLNADRIEKNRSEYEGTRIEFVSGDAMDWLLTHGERDSILLTYGGVLEYFTETELDALFAEMKNRSMAVCLTEPLGEDFDLANATKSSPYGYELSFSHNYPALLEKHGFTTCFERDHVLENRWIQLVATSFRSDVSHAPNATNTTKGRI